jgi:hypothetical protein
VRANHHKQHAVEVVVEMAAVERGVEAAAHSRAREE